MRKIYLELKLKAVVNSDEGVPTSEIVDAISGELDGIDCFEDTFDLESIDLEDYKVTDSK